MTLAPQTPVFACFVLGESGRIRRYGLVGALKAHAESRSLANVKLSASVSVPCAAAPG